MTTPAVIDSSAAERRAMKIGLRLDSLVEGYEAVMPMIREAVQMGDHETLGYRSPGEYLADRFGQSLARLPRAARQEAVREMTSLGMSTRAIAPVVGVDQKTIVRDIRREAYASPAVDTETGEVSPAEERSGVWGGGLHPERPMQGRRAS